MAPAGVENSEIIDEIMNAIGVARYGVWCIWWTGWKESLMQVILVGQWIAVQEKDFNKRFCKAACSSYPGSTGWLNSLWDMVDCNTRDGQAGVTRITPPEVKREYQRQALVALITFLLTEGLHPKHETEPVLVTSSRPPGRYSSCP